MGTTARATWCVLVASVVACEGTTGRVAPITLPPQPPPVVTAEPPAKPPPPPAPVVVIEGAPAPAKQPIDPSHKVDGSGLLLSLTSTEIWYLLGDHYTVVIDRATGCAVEGYRDPPLLVALQKNRDPASVEAQLKKPAVLQAIRDWVGLGRRLGARGQHFLMESAWSLDGRFIYLALNDLLYRSADGGRSFARVDELFSSRLAMSMDGKHLVYEHDVQPDGPSCSRSAHAPGCNIERQYVSLPTDGSRGPLGFTAGQTFLLEQRADGRALFWRSDNEICADTFDLGAPAKASSVCVPYPKRATGVWPGRQWESLSPSGRYGVVKWEEGRPNLVGALALTYVVSLVDMTTKKFLKEVTDVQAEVDDEGNMVAQSMSEGGGDHTYFYPLKGARKLLGHHHLVAWHDKTAILGVHRVAKLADRKCDLVKSVKTP